MAMAYSSDDEEEHRRRKLRVAKQGGGPRSTPEFGQRAGKDLMGSSSPASVCKATTSEIGISPRGRNSTLTPTHSAAARISLDHVARVSATKSLSTSKIKRRKMHSHHAVYEELDAIAKDGALAAMSKVCFATQCVS